MYWTEVSDEIVQLITRIIRQGDYAFMLKALPCCVDGEPAVTIVAKQEDQVAPVLVTITPGMEVTDKFGNDLDFGTFPEDN